MSVTPVQWRFIQHYSPKEYLYPDRLDYSIVLAMDNLAGLLKIKPQIIDDFRFSDTGSQHEIGRAVDFYVPNLDPLDVLDTIKKSKLFSGIGIYINEAGVVSFHGDTRTDRTTENPALWSGTKDPEGLKKWIYSGIDNVTNLIKEKKTPVILLLLAIAALIIYLKK